MHNLFPKGLYALSTVAYVVLILNGGVIDTFHDTLPGGQYYTERYNTFVWFCLMLSCCKLFMYYFVSFITLFRRVKGCYIFWFTLIVILFMIDVIVIIGLGEIYSKCNQQGQYYNICNSPHWCCAAEVFAAVENRCHNTVVCAAPLDTLVESDLLPNGDFLWLFYSNFAYSIVDGLILLFFAMAWCRCPTFGLKYQRDDDALLQQGT